MRSWDPSQTSPKDFPEDTACSATAKARVRFSTFSGRERESSSAGFASVGTCRTHQRRRRAPNRLRHSLPMLKRASLGDQPTVTHALAAQLSVNSATPPSPRAARRRPKWMRVRRIVSASNTLMCWSSRDQTWVRMEPPGSMRTAAPNGGTRAASVNTITGAADVGVGPLHMVCSCTPWQPGLHRFFGMGG